MSRSIDRRRIAPRLPCFSPVVASGLTHCWMTNISAGGMGLTALAEGTSTIPHQGDDVEIEFGLGHRSESIRAVARVAWTGCVNEGGRLGFGVKFRELSQRGRAHLARFLAEHRPRVIVAFASPSERDLVEDCLRDLDLEFIDRIDQLDAEHLHTSAAVLVFADELERMLAFLDALQGASSKVPIELPLASVTVVTDIDSERLLPLFTAEKIYEVLRPPLDARTLVPAAERSCERWALKFELRWASLQLEGSALSTQRPRPPTAPEEPTHRSHIIRESAAMQRVHELIKTVAVHDVPVLLTGETGTGKELAAREIHALSKRANTPFIAQDCGALLETLLESELFGHVRGAFTGATSDHPGLFQIADGGTIFLDEIQNTSPALQARLLRVVEEGEVRPVGGTKPRSVDVRVIAACNVDLQDAVARQRFRSDFYYRLNRFPIALPALRDHLDDILPLKRYFMATICGALGRPVPRTEPRADQALLAYTWPGNIRELRNTIERSLLLTKDGEPLRWETLPDTIRGIPARDPGDATSLDAQVCEFERKLIERALERNAGVVRRAARDLALDPVTLSRKMKKLGIATTMLRK